MFEGIKRFKDVKFNAPEESVDNQSIQYGVNPLYDCHRKCERDAQHPHADWIAEPMCKLKCNWKYGAPEKSDDQPIQHTVTLVQRLEEDTTTLSEIQSELENIGDSFYSLAGSFSVL